MAVLLTVCLFCGRPVRDRDPCHVPRGLVEDAERVEGHLRVAELQAGQQQASGAEHAPHGLEQAVNEKKRVLCEKSIAERVLEMRVR